MFVPAAGIGPNNARFAWKRLSRQNNQSAHVDPTLPHSRGILRKHAFLEAASFTDQHLVAAAAAPCFHLSFAEALAVCKHCRATVSMALIPCAHLDKVSKAQLRCNFLDMCDDALDPVYTFFESGLVMLAALVLSPCGLQQSVAGKNLTVWARMSCRMPLPESSRHSYK